MALRKNKQYTNKLLTLNWNELSYDDQLIFFGAEKYFLSKKTLMLENGDINKEMVSLHAKLKAVPADKKNDGKRKKIMEELTELDDKKAENWRTIDTWNEPEDSKGPEEITTDKAVQQALAREKRIKANKIYIYRAQKMVDAMDPKTEKEKKKKAAKIREIEKRKKELADMGQPYTKK